MKEFFNKKKVFVHVQTMASYHFLLWNFSFSDCSDSTLSPLAPSCLSHSCSSYVWGLENDSKTKKKQEWQTLRVWMLIWCDYLVLIYGRDLQLWVTRFGLLLLKWSCLSHAAYFFHLFLPTKTPSKHIFTSGSRRSVSFPNLPLLPSCPSVLAGQASFPQAFIILGS